MLHLFAHGSSILNWHHYRHPNGSFIAANPIEAKWVHEDEEEEKQTKCDDLVTIWEWRQLKPMQIDVQYAVSRTDKRV